MLENDYNPVVTKNELIDILYNNFQNLITKVDLERIMDDITKLEDANNKIYWFTKESVLIYFKEVQNINYNKENLKTTS